MVRYLFVLFLFVLTGCDMNLTDTVLLDDTSNAPQHVEVTTISEIPDHIKRLIWRDLDELIAELLNLETGNEVEARKLLAMILTRQKQEEYYNKYVDAGGIAIIGAKTLSDEEMLEAHKIALTMTEKRHELRERLSLETGFYFILTDLEWTRGKPKTLPEYHEWEVEFGGGPPVAIGVNMCLTVSGRFMCLASAGKRVQIRSKTYQIDCGDYWCGIEVYRQKWDAFTHEMAHAIEHAARQIDPNFYRELRQAHDNAQENNLWGGYYQGDYAMGNWKEYWAVASVYWFFTVQGQTRKSLQVRDPLIYNLLSKWYPVTEPFDSSF